MTAEDGAAAKKPVLMLAAVEEFPPDDVEKEGETSPVELQTGDDAGRVSPVVQTCSSCIPTGRCKGSAAERLEGTSPKRLCGSNLY